MTMHVFLWGICYNILKTWVCARQRSWIDFQTFMLSLLVFEKGIMGENSYSWSTDRSISLLIKLAKIKSYINLHQGGMEKWSTKYFSSKVKCSYTLYICFFNGASSSECTWLRQIVMFFSSTSLASNQNQFSSRNYWNWMKNEICYLATYIETIEAILLWDLIHSCMFIGCHMHSLTAYSKKKWTNNCFSLYCPSSSKKEEAKLIL